MRWLKLLVMAAALGPLCVAARALAAAPSASGVSANGDDLTVCCTAIFVPPAAAPAAEQAPPPQLFIPQVVGCTAIGNDAGSINGCPGVVMGCSEASFACEPSATSTGKKDCLCSGRLLGVPRL
ncbi:MAG TPA: hypothetical protein VFE56_05880 [Candidatus Binataceae bacterium]|jgi:hypothetical protein|nr:hypothetical protein [Candidatus Binataceae bacterium]